jgi:protein-L-isoaspartate(D-aspartate) O-methyltransferase
MDAASDWTALRARMVDRQLRARGIRDPRVLAAMAAVPRHEFVSEELRARAYDDTPLPIGHVQTISQPYVVALMCELAAPPAPGRALEIGTGCGYQAAVLSRLAAEVTSTEIVDALARDAASRLARLGYANVRVRHADGHRGAPDVAPFDAILVAAAPARVPAALLDQLAPDGRLVVPVGDADQELRIYRRTGAGIAMERVCGVAFVPMTGQA